MTPSPFSGLKNEEIAEKWWGRSDWNTLQSMNCWDIADLMRARFSNELGYKFAAAYPIYDRDEGNRIMYLHGSCFRSRGCPGPDGQVSLESGSRLTEGSATRVA